MTDYALLRRLDYYLDAVPRHAARVEEFGALTLFAMLDNGWPYYARPTLGAGDVTLTELKAVRKRQRQLRLPESVEWIDEITPTFRPVVVESGMSVQAVPLMVLRRPLRITKPNDSRVRLMSPDDPLLAVAGAVAAVSFGSPGTAIGTVGAAERDAAAAEMTAQQIDVLRDLMRRGLTVTAVAADDWLGPLCVGSHQPVDDVTEIVGVATLPAARRQGLATAITALLVDDAEDREITTIFLSADSEDVARMYARLGFEQVGTACIAVARQW